MNVTNIAPIRLTDFKVLSFDCYGTLIDWETGLLTAFVPWRRRTSTNIETSQLLEAFARHEASQQSETPAMPYPDVHAQVLGRIGAELNVPAHEGEMTRFGQSVPDWPAYPDSGPALTYLHEFYQLIILSNVDRGSFAASEAKLGMTFDAIYTAQDIGSYKPDVRNFDYLIEHVGERGFASGDLLHVAQSLFHDHGPARSRGLASAWIDRHGDKDGGGATGAPPPDVRYDFRFTSMAALADAHRAEISG